MNEALEKFNDLTNFASKILNVYSSFQMKDINYAEFKNKIFEQEEQAQEIPENTKKLIENVFSSMDVYKKNKSKYLDLILSNDE